METLYLNPNYQLIHSEKGIDFYNNERLFSEYRLKGRRIFAKQNLYTLSEGHPLVEKMIQVPNLYVNYGEYQLLLKIQKYLSSVGKTELYSAFVEKLKNYCILIYFKDGSEKKLFSLKNFFYENSKKSFHIIIGQYDMNNKYAKANGDVNFFIETIPESENMQIGPICFKAPLVKVFQKKLFKEANIEIKENFMEIIETEVFNFILDEMTGFQEGHTRWLFSSVAVKHRKHVEEVIFRE